MTDAIAITLQNIRVDRHLQYENYQVVSAVQALWGAVTPNMIAVSLCCTGPEVHLHFYLQQESPIDREEIEDVAAELEALQFTRVPIHTHVIVVDGPLQYTQVEGRPIFRRYESQAGA